jgi:hypothetical protein
MFPVLPYLMAVGLSTLWSTYPERAIDTLVELVKNVAIFWIIVETIRTRRAVERSMVILVGTAGLLGAVSLHQFFSGDFSSNYAGFARSPVANIVGDVNAQRIGGPLGSPNYFALILAATVVGTVVISGWYAAAGAAVIADMVGR